MASLTPWMGCLIHPLSQIAAIHLDKTADFFHNAMKVIEKTYSKLFLHVTLLAEESGYSREDQRY